MQQHQHQYIDRRRPHRFIDNSNKTRNEEFYAKLERIRLSSKQCSHRSATELLDESKAYFVKSQEVLRNRQTLLNNRTSNDQQQHQHQQQQQQQQQKLTPVFRTAQPRRFPYLDYEYEHDDRLQSDNFNLTTTSSSTTNLSDCGVFESVSLLSFSDQTTLNSANSCPNIKRTVLPSTSLTVIERNARIIKWLFQLNKANSPLQFHEHSIVT